ncbi:MAG TPA: hypothetical protein VFD43_02745, partial [Planctomycetota bacterium]|nr:hypothetical protein [Planctomycetota bacterium]
GVLVPQPALLFFGLQPNASGELQLGGTWPGGVPSGFSFYSQFWMLDFAGPQGFTASNGLAGTTP